MLNKVLTSLIIISIIGSFESVNFKKSSFKNGQNFSLQEKNVKNNISENSTIDFSNFKNSYFYNLRENFSRNVNNSCGYVGISMLLSYYDTFLSDDIIPEIYDVQSTGETNNMIERKNSPGVVNDYVNITNCEEYYQYLLNLSKPSFQGKLMQIALNENIIDSSFNGAFFTYFDDEVTILNSYFKNVLGYEYGKEYSLIRASSGSTNVENFTISKIKSGYPVLLSLKSKFSNLGHVVIAYDYDENENKIYCHTGFNPEFPDFNYFDVSRIFDVYKDALIIDFKIAHKHSNNYKVNNKTYCYKDCDINAYNGNDKEHHFSKYEKYNSTKHKYVCSNDDGYILRGHAVDSSKIFTNNGHMYANCIDCNYLVDLGSTSAITPSNNLFISKNGSYMLENGIYVIQKEDLEAYLNGTLFNRGED